MGLRRGRRLRLRAKGDQLEQEFVARQESIKPQEESSQQERAKVDDIRGTPMGVASLE